ncbi:MAG: cellobiose phosphorylase, partial [Anaerolineaceae bacterium]|nr:cellobiose phosphorylase [Anaerolineaceae bacterium]
MVDLTAGAHTDAPAAAEYLSPKTLQAHAILQILTTQYKNAHRIASGTTTASSLSLLKDLDAYEKRIIEGHSYFRSASQTDPTLSYASEWVLDNFYVIREAVRQIHENLPPRYYRQLPRLDDPPLSGYPRIYAIAREILAGSNLEVDEDMLLMVLEGFQKETPLTMGELWALPIFLRISAIEALAHALTHLMQREDLSALPNPPPQSGQGHDENVANAILSLRTVSELDWKQFFEQVNRSEQILRGDPPGIYPRMDFKTRNHYRGEIETIALKANLEEDRVASAALNLARQAASADGDGLGREGHVGYYLIGEGRAVLDQQLDVRYPIWHRLSRWILRHNQGVYISFTLGLALLLVLLVSLYTFAQPAALFLKMLVPFLLIVPALTSSTSLVNWAITLLFPPSQLPKLELGDEIPPEMQTLVVVPCMLTSRREIGSLAQQIEQHYLRNPQPGLFFGLLSDFSDADEENRPEDAALVEYAVELIEALNIKYPRKNGAPPFYLFHRRRSWNAVDQKWMGWERKRGKLHELNRLLRSGHVGTSGRGSTSELDLSFSQITGSQEVLAGVKYVITLDADTILPTGTAARLIGTLAHPLNRVRFAGDTKQVIAGYTVLQPRMEISPNSANRSQFTRIFAGDTGLDLYSRAVSDAYQDFFGEGIYVGKGIYDVDGFERSTAGSIPENALLSHDLLEGLLGRAGLVTDITMVEDYPPHYFVYAQRQHRWIRGDWQLLPWLFDPAGHGLRLSASDRWKMIDNLRRSLLSPALMLLFTLGWLVLPGSPWLWTAVALLAPALPLLTSLAHSATEMLQGEPPRKSMRPIRLSLLRWVLALAFIPYEAYQALDAILTTLQRVLFTHRGLLEWTTAAQSSHLFRKKNKQGGVVWAEMGPTVILTLILTALIALLNPAALLSALVLTILWLLAPFIIHRINQRLAKDEPPLSKEQTQLLRTIARRTWSFFERFAGPEDHWLPPDHFQESPLGVVAHRTSPSNIGLLLTSALAAFDLGY